jgi:hypothetical protein
MLQQLLVLSSQTVAYHNGSIIMLAPDAHLACRWCYGRPMQDLMVCSRVACILNVAWLQSLEVATAEDARGWHGDRPC